MAQTGPSQYPPRMEIEFPEGASTPEIETMVRNELSKNMSNKMQQSADYLYGRGEQTDLTGNMTMQD